MRISSLSLLPLAGAALIATSLLPAQGRTIYFSTDFTELSAHGNGVVSGVPGGSQAETFDDDEILLVEPHDTQNYFANSLAANTTFQAFFGDNDGDGNYLETVIGEVDALYLPPNAPNPPSLFDFFVSFRFFTKSSGSLSAGGKAIDDADVVRLLPGGGFVPFITELQLKTALGTVSSLDLNAFTVDNTTGDLYFSFNTSETVNGVTVEDGGVVRLPASKYVANPDGTVQSVTAGGAEIVLHESEVDTMFTGSGLNNALDITGLEIDPNGGGFVSSSTGLAMPNLWLCDEQSANGPTILSTKSGVGAPATLGTVIFNNDPTALGLSLTGFSALPARNLSALAYRPMPATGGAFNLGPLLLDTLMFSATPAPGNLQLDLSGGDFNGQTLILLKLGERSTPGSFTSRLAAAPILPFLGGFGELYIDSAGDPFRGIGIPVTIDKDGFGSFSLALPALQPVALTFQAIDLPALRLSTPVVAIIN